jgi:hypothetical protein
VGASGESELLKTVNKLDFTFPEWNARTGKIKMNDMPKESGKTFLAAYSDPDLTQEFFEAIDGDGSFVDVERGIALETVVKIYTTWLEGEYIKIFDSMQPIFSNMKIAPVNVDGKQPATKTTIKPNATPTDIDSIFSDFFKQMKI